MSIVRYNPEAKVYAPKVFSDILDNFFSDSLFKAGGKFSQFVPSVDIVENETSYEIHAALPGVKKEDVKIELNHDHIVLSGERKWEKEQNAKNYHVVETQYGTFSRTFYLPENVDAENIQAEFKDGILRVEVPKDQKKAKKVSINIK